jgi:hypothetical protein
MRSLEGIMEDLQNINKLASALLLFIKIPNWISHTKYIEKDRCNLNLSATMKRQNCLHFANRPLFMAKYIRWHYVTHQWGHWRVQFCMTHQLERSHITHHSGTGSPHSVRHIKLDDLISLTSEVTLDDEILYDTSYSMTSYHSPMKSPEGEILYNTISWMTS